MKNKKKIIHLIQALGNGGCENMLLRTLPHLSEFEHKIITLNHKGELAEQFEKANISIVNINQKNLLDIFSYFRLLKEIKKENPAIITTYLFHADIIGRLFLQIFTSAKIIPFLRTTYNHENYKFARFFEKLTKYFVKQYLANSESVKSFYIKNIGVSAEKITVIPNGIDTVFYDRIKRDENLRKSFGINTDEIAMICVANLHINKGHEYLLEAFENVYTKNKNIKLLLVGDGKEKENLQKQIENYQSKNNILFLGKRSDVPQLLKISDIFVLPTLFEGMSNAIMEAMASKLPVIASDIPENHSLLNENEGLFFKAKNSKQLAEKIFLLLESHALRNNLGENAKKRIFEKFELNATAKKFSNILNQFIE